MYWFIYECFTSIQKALLNHAMMQRTVDREEAAKLEKEGPAREERLGLLREERGRVMNAVEEGGVATVSERGRSWR